MRRSLRRIALAGVVGLSMAGLAGVATAQETGPAEPAPAASVPAAEETGTQPEPEPEPQPEPQPEPPIVVEPGAGQAGDEGTGEQTGAPAGEEGSEGEPAGDDPKNEEKASEESDAPEVPADEEPQPITLEHLSVQTDCYADGHGEMWVYVRNADGTRSLSATVQGRTLPMEWDSGYYTAYFDDIEGGTFPVRVFGDDVDLTIRGDASECYDGAPAPEDHFVVEVSCVDGNGVVTIQVYNPDERETRYYTIEIDDAAGETALLDPYIEYPFYADVIATITEVGPDGSYVFRLVDGEEVLDEQTVVVSCPDATPTTPPAQGAPAPGGGNDDGGLANTGAAVGGLAALGGLALVLGAALVLSGRRRAARVESD